MSDGAQTTLVESSRSAFLDLAWDEAGALTMVDEAGVVFCYDLASGGLEVVATPDAPAP